MNDKAWDAVTKIVSAICVLIFCLFVTHLVAAGGPRAHEETLAKIQACSVEYVYNQTANVYYLGTEYCSSGVPKADQIRRLGDSAQTPTFGAPATP